MYWLLSNMYPENFGFGAGGLIIRVTLGNRMKGLVSLYVILRFALYSLLLFVCPYCLLLFVQYALAVIVVISVITAANIVVCMYIKCLC